MLLSDLNVRYFLTWTEHSDIIRSHFQTTRVSTERNAPCVGLRVKTVDGSWMKYILHDFKFYSLPHSGATPQVKQVSNQRRGRAGHTSPPPGRQDRPHGLPRFLRAGIISYGLRCNIYRASWIRFRLAELQFSVLTWLGHVVIHYYEFSDHLFKLMKLLCG